MAVVILNKVDVDAVQVDTRHPYDQAHGPTLAMALLGLPQETLERDAWDAVIELLDHLSPTQLQSLKLDHIPEVQRRVLA